jgi:membrane protein
MTPAGLLDGADPRDGTRGRAAHRPSELTLLGWRDVLLRVWSQIGDDNLGLVSAGVAYYALFAIFPALGALVSLYGLVADPADVARQLGALRGLPMAVRDLLLDQLARIASSSETALGWGLVGSILLSVYSAARGMGSILIALNIAYEEPESRGFLQAKLVGFAFTLGAVLLAAVALATVVGAPIVLAWLPLGPLASLVLGVLPWLLLSASVFAGLLLLYRHGPHRTPAKWRWVVPGALVSTALWLISSLGLSLYVARFGDYNEVYGTVGAVVVLLLWFYLTAYVVVLGAELNAEMEHQTRCDTTRGAEKPMGERGAHMADTLGEVPPSPWPWSA